MADAYVDGDGHIMENDDVLGPISKSLVIIGDMVLRAAAALILDEFTKRIRHRLESDVAPV